MLKHLVILNHLWTNYVRKNQNSLRYSKKKKYEIQEELSDSEEETKEQTNELLLKTC